MGKKKEAKKAAAKLAKKEAKKQALKGAKVKRTIKAKVETKKDLKTPLKHQTTAKDETTKKESFKLGTNPNLKPSKTYYPKLDDGIKRGDCVGEKFCRAGYILVIKKQPFDTKGKKIKVDVGAEMVIQKPKKGYLNSLAGSFVKDKKGKLVHLQFPYIRITGRKA